MAKTIIFGAENNYRAFLKYLFDLKLDRMMIVCGESAQHQQIFQYLTGVQKHIIFSDFKPNPDYLSVWEGIQQFKKAGCDGVLGFGGGSAIDVAKCIKLYADAGQSLFFKYEIVPNEIPLLAIPTTAGSGSEATRFAVIYCEDKKLSINHLDCIPQAVLLDPDVLNTTSLDTKKAALLDALCHSIESMWSINSTSESKSYAFKAIKLILANMFAYLAGDKSKNAAMLQAAHLAGKAINISQTTAGHAMCYKLTSLYGLAHGHAAALCLSGLLRYTVNHLDECIDSRGEKYFSAVLQEIAAAMGCADFAAAAEKFAELLRQLELGVHVPLDNSDYAVLIQSVNPVRLKNNPLRLDKEAVNEIYHKILENGV